MKRCLIFVLLPLLGLMAGCSKVDSLMKESSNSADAKKTGAVNVPRNIKNTFSDPSAVLESSCILTLPNGGDILRGERKLAKGEIVKEIADCFKEKTPDKKVVYIKADASLDYGNILDAVDGIRKAQGEKISLVVSPNDGADDLKSVLELKIPAEINHDAKLSKPNPLTLIVFLEPDGKIKLNQDEQGSLENLTEKLKNIFRDREENGVFREGTNEIEKTVFIKAPRTVKYSEVVKLIDALRESRAEPIGLQLDEFPQDKQILDIPPPKPKSVK